MILSTDVAAIISTNDGNKNTTNVASNTNNMNNNDKSIDKAVEMLLRQNAALEYEISRLNIELDESRQGIVKRGYLFKWRDREISYASKWGLRYFILSGKLMSYFNDEKSTRALKTIDLSRCVVKDEGTKRGGQYHVFAIYLAVADSVEERGNLLLRLSSESRADALMWIDMLEQGCALQELTLINNNSDSSKSNKSNSDGSSDSYSIKNSSSHNDNDNNYNNTLSISTTDFNNLDKIGNINISNDNNNNSNDNDNMYYTMDNNQYNKSRSSSKSDNELLSDLISEVQTMNDEDWNNSVDLEEKTMKDNDYKLTQALKRVQSSSKVLQQSLSRQTMSRKILSLRSPNNFSVSGSRLSSLPPTASPVTKDKHKDKPMTARTFPGSKSMHIQNISSPLSTDVRGGGEQNFRGFFNLGVIILILTNFRIIIENLAKHGLLVSLPHFIKNSFGLPEPVITTSDTYANSQWTNGFIHGFMSWVLSAVLAYLIEKAAARCIINDNVALVLHFILGTCNILLPTVWVWYTTTDPGSCMVYLFQAVIIWMKLISYAHANRDLRRLRVEKMKENVDTPDDGSSNLYYDSNGKPLAAAILAECRDLEPPYLSYPMNITFTNLLYFCVVPTLCYQLNYPRSHSIRWKYVGTILLRMLAVTGLILFTVEQDIKPTLELSLQAMSTLNVIEILERLVKLSIPNTYVWLLGFYFYFHLWLNLIAELTRFGDRLFYKDWWNSRTIEEYWRNWNIPVHNWMVRHLYHPLIRLKVSKRIATFACFLLSAILHELIISTPFRYYSLHAFGGMLAQAPLIFITKLLDRSFDNAFLGNCVFWCLFCVIGQPMGILMYYHDLFTIKACSAL